MKLFIVQKKENDIKEIFASFAKNELKITENSENWNSAGINDFLIKLATNIPEDEIIDLEYDKNNEDVIFIEITKLFENFVNEYNSLAEEAINKFQ